MKATDKRRALKCSCMTDVDCPEAVRIRARASRSWASYKRTGSLKALSACRARITEYEAHHAAACVPEP